VRKEPKKQLEWLSKVYSVIDKAAKVGVIKKNNASNKKSRLAKITKDK
jgi:ribosomal protein S20